MENALAKFCLIKDNGQAATICPGWTKGWRRLNHTLTTNEAT